MKGHNSLNILLLCLGGIFFILGSKFGNVACYFISSISLIIWATLFVCKKKKATL